MKKTEIYPNNEVIYALPPETIGNTEKIGVADYLLPRSEDCLFDYSKVRRFSEENFTMKIGGTYEVSTHFNLNSRQCVMEQFKELILSEKLI